MENMLGKAIALCATTFMNTTDKGGRPYFEHCDYVASAGLDDEEKAAGYLHDIIEDTDETVDTLRDKGYPERVILIVDALTKRPEEIYKAYIKRVAYTAIDPAVRRLKLKDLEHNCQPIRLKSLSKKNMDKLEEYFWAYQYLKSI